MNAKIITSLLAIVAVGAAAIGGTYAWFSSQQSSTGNTFSSGTVALKLANINSANWADTVAATWNFTNMAPGGAPQESILRLENQGTVKTESIDLSLAHGDDSGSGIEKQLRITKLTIDGLNMLKGGAGATIGAYVAPTNCTVTVSGTKITDAITTAAAGAVICAAPGDYNASWEGVPAIAVSKSVTIVSIQGPVVTTSIPFNVTASNVTIRGFGISNPGGTYGVQISGGVSHVAVVDNNINHVGTTPTTGSAQGIFLQNGSVASSDFTFTGNTISNIGNLSLAWDGAPGSGTSAKGIYIGDTSSAGAVTGVTIKNNVISHVQASTAAWTAGRGAYGVMANVSGGVANLVVMSNSISDLEGLWSHAVGLEGNTPNASVTLNDIHNLVDHKGNIDAVGVQIESPNTNSANITINQNNFTPNVVLGINNVATGAATVNGQNNWWGDQNPSDQVGGPVNTAGFLGGPVVGLINGTDQNSNGFADLQDLRLSPIVGFPFELVTNVEKQLVMGVQLDGPTTDNSFQGKTLTTDVVVNIHQ